MADLKPALTTEDVKKAGVANIRIEYNKLASVYNKILNNDLLLCPVCNTWQDAKTGFYSDKKNATGRFYECKKCLLKEVEQRESDREKPNETKASVQKVLQRMNRVYDNTFYEKCIKGSLDETNEKLRHSPWSTYITSICSLPQYQNKTWEDSYFGEDVQSQSDEERKVIQKTVKEGRKVFGSSYSNEDLMFLMNQYDDWRTRTQVDSKSQETYVTQICLQLLDIDKDRRSGKDVTNKLKALDVLMNAANLQPKQNINNAATDALSFSQLVEKLEQERPVSDPDPEFKDVNNIGHLIRVYFSGHLSKALGLKTAYSKEYDEEMQKYTVEKPQENEENITTVYKDIFGGEE